MQCSEGRKIRLTRDEKKVIRRALADVVIFCIEIGDVTVDAFEELVAALVGCFGVDVGFAVCIVSVSISPVVSR
jgi:hypothetical protein